MITFRVVENFLAGYGLGYNPFIRVQAFTHPLWMFLISLIYFIERLVNPDAQNALFYITISLSILLSFFTLYFLLSKISQPRILPLGLSTLILSLTSSYIDFSTSGLENPLTHFLLIVFVIVYLTEAPNLLLLSLVSSFILLNRIDTFILILPALFYTWLISRHRKRGFVNILIGIIPFILWELFSLFYFGFLFPNTAYAKLNIGVSGALLIQQGFDYLLNSVNWEPIVFFSIGLAGVTILHSKNKKFTLLFTGILLYIIYIVKIGGDFMSGRFLTAPLLLSVAIISNQLIERKNQIVSISIIFLIGAFSLRSPLLSSNMTLYFPYPIGDNNGISDQRLFYFGNYKEGHFNSFVENGFREASFGSQFAGDKWYFMGFKKVIVTGALGRVGYEKGPNIYVIDNYALADPLLARLAVQNKYWQIGHFYRDLPDGYYETLESGENNIVNSDLALYYSKLSILTQGRLYYWERIVEIWKFNTGQYDYLLEKYKQHQ